MPVVDFWEALYVNKCQGTKKYIFCIAKQDLAVDDEPHVEDWGFANYSEVKDLVCRYTDTHDEYTKALDYLEENKKLKIECEY